MATTVAVCALTYNRPVGLAALLASLAKLEDPGDAYEVKVIIVDNDPAESARPLVERWQGDMPWELVYASERRRGIPFGRNTAVRMARGSDFIAFLDDDELAETNWLAELLRVQRSTGADVVTGTVLPLFEEPPPTWAVEGGFYERPRFATGQRIDYARTSNVLIAARVFPPGDPAPFNEAMGLNGGDDTHFFQRAVNQGFSIVWADDAIVHDSVPASRVNPWWVLKREYRRGNTLSLCLRDLQDTWWRRLRRAANGCLHIARGIPQALVGLSRGRAATLTGLKHISLGAGLLTGLAGIRYDEYTVVHGS
ncbi:glycosyltransferase [Desertimonas flava]|uniref:glycosyltransferase n=1 Tax=Desertimonas flava TaxID=2064846 RepID=UPI000E356826|nr:glycosyltransferase [Desertimonas flava]